MFKLNLRAQVLWNPIWSEEVLTTAQVGYSISYAVQRFGLIKCPTELDLSPVTFAFWPTTFQVSNSAQCRERTTHRIAAERCVHWHGWFWFRPTFFLSCNCMTNLKVLKWQSFMRAGNPLCFALCPLFWGTERCIVRSPSTEQHERNDLMTHGSDSFNLWERLNNAR